MKLTKHGVATFYKDHEVERLKCSILGIRSK